ncbi:hypothetical protein QYF36_021616 [Acer negundo]|nr:hypothetical protein QYF36_021616 [Acer negundo]
MTCVLLYMIPATLVSTDPGEICCCRLRFNSDEEFLKKKNHSTDDHIQALQTISLRFGDETHVHFSSITPMKTVSPTLLLFPLQLSILHL